ncbi:MAG: hypothetical protein M3261_01300 [Thermoproteota archaeon]|nr:hypothetical protein [Thermoproteota archaeon]
MPYTVLQIIMAIPLTISILVISEAFHKKQGTGVYSLFNRIDSILPSRLILDEDEELGGVIFAYVEVNEKER